jgi:hypothetical protein
MFSPQLLRMAFRWAVLITLVAGALVAVEPTGTPQFIISAIMLGVGLLFGILVAVLSRIPGGPR